jgi:hypothetical protein
MRHLINLIIAVAIAESFAGLAQAQTTTCRAQLVHTVCGSGKVEITYSEKEETFKVYNGDVGCWMTDYEINGGLKKVPSRYPYFLENTFKLTRLDTQTVQMGDFGALFVDTKLKVARLEIFQSSENEKAMTKYDLTCE